jgi:hypothetical protein
MTCIAGHNRSQLLLLPEAVDDYVGFGQPGEHLGMTLMHHGQAVP